MDSPPHRRSRLPARPRRQLQRLSWLRVPFSDPGDVVSGQQGARGCLQRSPFPRRGASGDAQKNGKCFVGDRSSAYTVCSPRVGRSVAWLGTPTLLSLPPLQPPSTPPLPPICFSLEGPLSLCSSYVPHPATFLLRIPLKAIY